MKKHRSLAILLLTGLMVRLFLMLFALHPQFMQMYFFAYRTYVGEIQAFHSSYSTGLQFIINIWFTIMTLTAPTILHLFEVLPKGEPLSFATIPPALYFARNLIPFLFVAKIPLFIADMGCLLLAARLFRSWKTTLFWSLNPVIWVGVYIFGRPEIIIVFFLMYGYYSLKRGNNLIAWISFFLAHLFLPVLLLFTIPLYLLKPVTSHFRQQTGIIALSMIIYFFYPHLFTSIFGLGIVLIMFFYLLGDKKMPLRITPGILALFTGLLFLFNIQLFTRLSGTIEHLQQAQLTTLLLNFRLAGINAELFIMIVYFIFALLFLVQKKIPANRENILTVLLVHTSFVVMLMFTTLEYLIIALPVFYAVSREKYKHFSLLVVLAAAGFFFFLMHWHADVLLHPFAIFAPRDILARSFFSGVMPYQLASLGKSILAGCLLYILAQELPRLKKVLVE